MGFFVVHNGHFSFVFAGMWWAGKHLKAIHVVGMDSLPGHHCSELWGLLARMLILSWRALRLHTGNASLTRSYLRDLVAKFNVGDFCLPDTSSIDVGDRFQSATVEEQAPNSNDCGVHAMHYALVCVKLHPAPEVKRSAVGIKLWVEETLLGRRDHAEYMDDREDIPASDTNSTSSKEGEDDEAEVRDFSAVALRSRIRTLLQRKADSVPAAF